MDQTRRAANRLQSQIDSIIMVTMLAKMVVMIITMRPGGRRDVMILNTEIIFFHSKKGLRMNNPYQLFFWSSPSKAGLPPSNISSSCFLLLTEEREEVREPGDMAIPSKSSSSFPSNSKAFSKRSL